MKLTTSLVLLSLGASVSASVNIISSSKCWRNCARKVGVQCSWSDISCNCRAVNAGLYAAANQCYCNTCSDETTRIAVDWTSIQLNTFSIACAVFEPLNRQAIDTAVDAASCKASGVNSIVVPIASTASQTVSYSYATITVPVTPVPVEPHATATTSSSSSSSGKSNAPTKTVKSTASNGTKNAAEEIRPRDVTLSAFALAMAAIFGMA